MFLRAITSCSLKPEVSLSCPLSKPGFSTFPDSPASSQTFTDFFFPLRLQDFGMSRYIDIGSRLTGWNAVKSRVEQLELELTDEQVKDVTAKVSLPFGSGSLFRSRTMRTSLSSPPRQW